MAQRIDIDFTRFPDSFPWHYSQAVRVGEMVFVAGQVGANAGDITAQTQKAYEKVVEQLAKAGATMDDVVRETVYLANRDWLADVAKVRATFYSRHWPASTAVFSGSGNGYDIEVEVTAIIGAGATDNEARQG
jgi:enamine deaminase RidA (YjgF/YER057c/UK114 family)